MRKVVTIVWYSLMVTGALFSGLGVSPGWVTTVVSGFAVVMGVIGILEEVS